jgi:hypothetical protein
MSTGNVVVTFRGRVVGYATSQRMAAELIETDRAEHPERGGALNYIVEDTVEPEDFDVLASVELGHFDPPGQHPYADAKTTAAWVHITAFGTFYVCHECHGAGHCPSKDPTNPHTIQRVNAASLRRRCQCEHAAHMGGA